MFVVAASDVRLDTQPAKKLRVASQSKPASAYSFLGCVSGRPGLPPTAGNESPRAESPSDRSDWPRPRESPAARRRDRPATCISSLFCGDRQDSGRWRRHRQKHAPGSCRDGCLRVQYVFLSQHGQQQVVRVDPKSRLLPGLQPGAHRFTAATHLLGHIFPATTCYQNKPNHLQHDTMHFGGRPSFGAGTVSWGNIGRANSKNFSGIQASAMAVLLVKWTRPVMAGRKFRAAVNRLLFPVFWQPLRFYWRSHRGASQAIGAMAGQSLRQLPWTIRCQSDGLVGEL